MSFQTNILKPVETPRWIMSVRDLTDDRTPAKYEVTNADGSTSVVTLKDRKRQVVDAMLIGPVFCASTVRLGDAVFRLKEDNNLHAATKTTAEGRKFYTLSGQGVRRIDGGVV
ncbi:hypothetical protein SAMN04488523_101411 [Sulfitobacter brevis]|uniref:Uncharacterized protein n=1 Tax=Sulfitobacter brevis TaxID=74348 RepID=A0A1I1TJB6_9RHOB|nr:hypothetical protein [Sulfitobacter brevis]SFD58736.1 hypothetical protein SAMN04488523_101411 [Sulfitobacter brevis]